jgi:L-histidine N-alpha-methyltransferase
MHLIKEEKRILNPRCEIYNYLDCSFTDYLTWDITEGMNGKKKYIPSKYFYDAVGSQLFEKICTLPEYYLTRTEILILEAIAPSIIKASPHLDLVEMGPGSEEKISRLIKASSCRNGEGIRYIAFDVSESALYNAARYLTSQFSQIQVMGYVADFTRHLHHLPSMENTVFMLLGSTIGNFTPDEMGMLLKSIARAMNQEDRFLLGLDMIKDPAIIESAYNDSRGVTAEFNKNILHVMNREASADFDPDEFDHLSIYNRELEQIEMYLVANRPVTVTFEKIPLMVRIEKGESILTEISRKFSRESLEAAALSCDLEVRSWHTDSGEWFSLVELARVHQCYE